MALPEVPAVSRVFRQIATVEVVVIVADDAAPREMGCGGVDVEAYVRDGVRAGSEIGREVTPGSVTLTDPEELTP